MISWWTSPLWFLYVFMCRLQTEAHCFESLNPASWVDTTYKITFHNLTQSIEIVDADSFEDMMKCTLANEIKKGRGMEHLLRRCMHHDPNTPLKTCRGFSQVRRNVSFHEFMCLVAYSNDLEVKGVSPTTVEVAGCSKDVVDMLVASLHETSTTTTLPTTKLPSTVKKVITTATPSMSTWSSSAAALQLPTGDASLNHTDYNKQLREQEVKDISVFLWLSVVMNLVLLLLVFYLCRQRPINNENVRAAENGSAHPPAQEMSHLVPQSEEV